MSIPTGDQTAAYVLWHARAFGQTPDAFETKVLGVFGSVSNANEARSAALNLEGFRDYPDGFDIERIPIDEPLFQDDELGVAEVAASLLSDAGTMKVAFKSSVAARQLRQHEAEYSMSAMFDEVSRRTGDRSKAFEALCSWARVVSEPRAAGDSRPFSSTRVDPVDLARWFRSASGLDLPDLDDPSFMEWLRLKRIVCAAAVASVVDEASRGQTLS